MRKVQSNNYVIVLYNTNRVLCFGAKPRQAHNQPSQDQRSSPARINTPAQPESTPQPSQHQHSSPADINTPAQPTSTLQPSRHQHSSTADINTPAQPTSTLQPSQHQHPNPVRKPSHPSPAKQRSAPTTPPEKKTSPATPSTPATNLQPPTGTRKETSPPPSHLRHVDIAYKLCYLVTYLMLSYVNPGPFPSTHGPRAQLMCLAHGDTSSQPPPPLSLDSGQNYPQLSQEYPHSSPASFP